MSSFITNKCLELISNGGLDFDNASQVLRAMLERSTSTYAPNRDHDFLDDFTGGGGVEISVASYSRQTIGTKSVSVDNVNDLIKWLAGNLAFGNLESGQTVKSVLIYLQVGGNDATPADDPFLIYFDGKVDVVLAANAANGATTIYVDPLVADLPSGAALNFGGGATGTLSVAASRGDRSLSLSGGGLAASANAGAKASDVAITGNILPFALGGGAFNVNLHADGLVNVKSP